MVVCDIHNVKADRDKIQSKLLRRIEAGIAGIAVGRARHDRFLIDEGVIGSGNLLRDIAVDGEKIVLLVGIPAGFRVHVDIRMDEVVPCGNKGNVHAEIRIGKLCRFQRCACFIGKSRFVRDRDPTVGIRRRFTRCAVGWSGRLRHGTIRISKMEAAGQGDGGDTEQRGEQTAGRTVNGHGGYPLRRRFSVRRSL